MWYHDVEYNLNTNLVLQKNYCQYFVPAERQFGCCKPVNNMVFIKCVGCIVWRVFVIVFVYA